jgi:hypothetical protein
MLKLGFGAQGAAGDPKPQMFNLVVTKDCRDDCRWSLCFDRAEMPGKTGGLSLIVTAL